MLIKLLAPSHPTVLFAITYQNLPEELYYPLAWTALLSSLDVDHLEPPQFIHALDKASWIPSILEEITFNMTSLTICCHFVDGSSEEWPLAAPACLKAMESVLRDVAMSSVQAQTEREREKEREREREREREEKRAKRDSLKQKLARQQQQSLNSPPATVKVTKHKKNRSLLLSFVSNFVTLPSHHDRTASAPTTRVPSPARVEAPVKIEPDSPQAPSLSSKALRRRARSTLVDTFRVHVLSELRLRLPEGGYYPWIVKSMLRRASWAMADIISQSDTFNLKYTVSPLHDESYFPPPALVSPSEQEDDDADTDTDGSSIRTPSIAHFTPTSFSIYSEDSLDCADTPRHLRGLSHDDLNKYNSLSALCVRFRQLLILVDAQKDHVENETKQRDAILEIRSRRRAWQNKSLFARTGDMNVGLATPYTSSRLSQVTWTAEEYEYGPPAIEAEEDLTEEYGNDDMELGSRRTRGRSDAKLFPVSEDEDEEDEVFNPRVYELELGFDEGLRSWKIEDEEEEDEGDTKSLQTSTRPRARTNSMHQNKLPSSRSPVMDAQSFLPEGPPMYTKVDIAGIGAPLTTYGRYSGDEFTLSMDTVSFHTGLSVSTMDPEPEKDWLAPRFTPEVI